MTPDELARGGNPDRQPMLGCLPAVPVAVASVIVLLARAAVSMVHPVSLADRLADGDLALLSRGNLDRKAYGLKLVDGTWVIGVAVRAAGRAGLGGQAILDEHADIENQAYLESMGWGR